MRIEEAYVSQKMAKMLKDYGFDEPCEYFYRFDSEVMIYRGIIYSNSQLGDKFYNAPTHQRVVRWLRERYGIVISITHMMGCALNKGWGADIVVYEKKIEIPQDNNSYEEAVEEAIQYCLKNLI